VRALLLALAAAVVGPAAGAAAPPSSPPPAAEDPILALLEGDDYEQARPALLRHLGRPGGPRCADLGRYAGNRSDRVRENAVRALGDAGCDRLDPYRPYLADASPWVIEAVLRAAERHALADAVPFLIDHLDDRRRIVSADGSFTIGEIALRALRVVTGQPLSCDPAAPETIAAAVAEWRDWHARHRAEPRSAWLAAGVARAREQAAGGDPALRLEALRLLALLGPPAAPDLRAALGRSAGDLGATLTCEPDEPPRVTDEVPCVLTIANRAGHRVALAVPPGDPRVRLARIGAQPQEPPVRGRAPARDDRPRTAAGGEAAAGGGTAPGAPEASAGAEPAEVAALLLDLAPGESLRREFRVGPVAAPGRYEVRAGLADLAVPPAQASIEAVVVLRFEQ
jgi:hypothetical protein